MSALDRFLDGSGAATSARRNRAAIARQTSVNNSAALVEHHRAELAHRAALERTDQLAERAVRVAQNTAAVVSAGREEANGDAFAAELIMETVQLAHRRMNDQI